MIHLKQENATGSVYRVERLDVRQVRHVIECLRLKSLDGESPFALITIDCNPTSVRNVDKIVAEIDALDELLFADWAHEKQVGWLGQECLGIVLPNAGPVDASSYQNQIRQFCEIPDSAIDVYCHHRTVLSNESPAVHIESIEDYFVKPLPLWKRLMDISGSLFGLTVSFPFLAICEILIKLTSRGPVMFRQDRVGLGGRPFQILKLRTMFDGADEQKSNLLDQNQSDGLGFKIAEDPRVTPIGKFLRKTSLDELPQLINVLFGQMSLVGPRPLPCSDWQPTELWMNSRHDVTPGITCTWQVHGRSRVSFDEWMAMDIQYVNSRSIGLDAKLLAETLPAVASRRGAW
jgi:lipopolysaccharide/colanic/teichoic acid biosynthesis glycosyltransferase